MNGKPSREELLSVLWEAFVFAESNDADRKDRQKAAFGALQVQRQKYEDAGTRSDGLADALMAHGRAKTIWTILATDLAGWLVTMPGFLGLKQHWADYTDGNERAALIEHLNESEAAIPAPHRPAIDPVPVLLPRRLFICLKDALEALEKGEVHPVLRPKADGRHDDPWTWDKMRARAVDYVTFLHGQGVQLRIARQWVGAAMKVSPETLRKWECDPSLGANVETARKAGAYKAQLDADPKHCEDDGQSVDGQVLALFLAFQDEPLKLFGERYSRRFGQRHNTPVTGGD